jgi:hypothetical protein
MKDERDNGEDDQDMNKEAGDVKQKKTTAPGQDQKDCKKKPHREHLVVSVKALP